MTRKPQCRQLDVDGKPVRARAVGELTEADIKAIREFQELLKSKGRCRDTANPRGGEQ